MKPDKNTLPKSHFPVPASWVLETKCRLPELEDELWKPNTACRMWKMAFGKQKPICRNRKIGSGNKVLSAISGRCRLEWEM